MDQRSHVDFTTRGFFQFVTAILAQVPPHIRLAVDADAFYRAFSYTDDNGSTIHPVPTPNTRTQTVAATDSRSKARKEFDAWSAKSQVFYPSSLFTKTTTSKRKADQLEPGTSHDGEERPKKSRKPAGDASRAQVDGIEERQPGSSSRALRSHKGHHPNQPSEEAPYTRLPPDARRPGPASDSQPSPPDPIDTPARDEGEDDEGTRSPFLARDPVEATGNSEIRSPSINFNPLTLLAFSAPRPDASTTRGIRRKSKRRSNTAESEDLEQPS